MSGKTLQDASKIPPSPPGSSTRYLLISVALSDDYQAVIYDTFTDTVVSSNNANGASTHYMLAYSWGACSGNVTRGLVEISFSAPIAGRGGKPTTIMVPNSASPRDLSRALLLGDPLTTPEYYLVLNGKVLSRSLLTQPLYATPHDVAGYCLQLRYRLRGGMQGQGGAGIGPRGDVHMNSATSGSSPLSGQRTWPLRLIRPPTRL
jgi:hypothetical protein